MLPAGKFDVVLLDPPWSYYGQQSKWGAAAKFYDTMPDEALLALDVPSLLKPTSVVFCWATSPRLDFAIRTLGSWGLHYRGVSFVWVKTSKSGKPFGARGVRPSIVKPTTEFVLAASMAPKGRPMPVSDESVPQVVLAAPGRHSEKPDEVQARIERLYPSAKRLEMFARRCREGWQAWGNEIHA
ncbi:MAG: DNA methyltransferase [Caulobacteraceae bacterium]|nr:DNA methyltransferase [Caulobacteraceae bacterium]